MKNNIFKLEHLIISQFIKIASLFVIVSLCSISLHAKESTSGFRGVGLGMGLGYPSVSLRNPDDSTAYYNGVSLLGRVLLPIFNTDIIDLNFHTSARYLDLKNTASNSQTEVANHIGLGPGLSFDIGRISLGAEYLFMSARHYAIGPISSSMQYAYQVVSGFAGWRFTYKTISFGISYSMGFANIPANQTGLSKATPYTDQIIWLKINYSTGNTIGDTFRNMLGGGS